MTLFFSMLIFFLAASKAQATPAPVGVEEQVPDIGEEQVPDDGEEQDSEGGEEQDLDDGDEVPEESQTEDISVRILTSNNNSADFFLEGDILPPKTRNAISCWYDRCRWPKGPDGKVTVAYTVSRVFQSHEKKLITRALDDFGRKTCIHFVPRQRHNDYISVESKQGCFSSLGRQGRKQVISLDKKGCVYYGIIQHEFIHALGFKHEQTRSDRDRYVKINWNNMQQSMAHNFQKSTTNNLDTPYDYGSIMHYGKTAFSTNGRDTITPLTPAKIGQRKEMSRWDIERINRLYNC